MEMRRKDRQLTQEEAIMLLEESEYGVLSTVGEDGMPYGVPMSFAYKEGKIYMHCALAEGHKLQNLNHSKKASFTVVNHTEVLPEAFSTKFMSAIAFGNVEILELAEEKKEGLTLLLEKYSSDFMEKGIKYRDSAVDKVCVLMFEIKELTAKGRKK